MSVVDLPVARAREQLKSVLDAADAGVPTTIVRAGRRVALVDAVLLRATLAHTLRPDVQLAHEAGEWAAFMPGTSLSGTGRTTDEAVDDLIAALQEYAEDWTDHLRHAPNHRDSWALVQLVELSTDDELRDWLTGAHD
ncbi:prevent-host-death protein [Cellulomonas sp. IC4_254]|uniref:prevent-host-death protein n=1 Tax=Cellulomonas sp. IC4_254 TaxID=2714040 RepID=UPI00141F1FD4|nr:prevent-host-death protein [Cellulomonas sp. IC4_254]NHT16750.1 prevent-host-death protein [Cellulomonas sp. IC4_254]